MVEQLICNQLVVGSIPTAGSLDGQRVTEDLTGCSIGVGNALGNILGKNLGIFSQEEKSIRVKAIEKELYRRENKYIYWVRREGGRLVKTSLGTRRLGEARAVLKELKVGLRGSGAAAGPPDEHPPDGVSEPAEDQEAQPPVQTLEEALTRFDASQVVMSQSMQRQVREMRAIVLRCGSLDLGDFDPVGIWNAYRLGGKPPLVSRPNHLRTYLRRFVEWAVEGGHLPEVRIEKAVRRIPLLKVNPRRIRVPSAEAVGELLAMIAVEKPGEARFLRFLAVTGLRLSGALGLCWDDIDFVNRTMLVRQKGGRETVIPLGGEALELLRQLREIPTKLKGSEKLFKYSDRAQRSMCRRLRRFSGGLEVDLQTFHSFRHYFASRALMAGLGVQEVATLLGHNDGGVLVLRTYGHICGDHLRQAVAGLKLAG